MQTKQVSEKYKCQYCNSGRKAIVPLVIEWKHFVKIDTMICFGCENRLEIIVNDYLENPKEFWSKLI